MIVVGKTDSILLWLRCICIGVAIIMVVGGITRLTDSGLSMVDWRPVMGILPPLTDADWEEVFASYQQIPQGKYTGVATTMDEFKSIFFWEYLHRILGRLVGLICLLPYLWLLWKDKLSKALKIKGLCLVVLVVLQGLIGWYMVKSGVDPGTTLVKVSHYRLALHLSLAFALFGLAWWMILDLHKGKERGGGLCKLRFWAMILLGVFCLQVIYGAFVSGLKAGYGFNTFPRMGVEWVPAFLFQQEPFWRNLLEDPFTMQFIHRWIGTCLTMATVGLGAFALRSGLLDATQHRNAIWLLVLVLVQFALGVSTLLFLPDVRIVLPIIHQLVALFLFTAFLSFIHSLGDSTLEQ